jgi:hypothetical protein
MNRKWIVWMGVWFLALPWCLAGVSASEPVTVVEKEFFWSSPNIEEMEIPGPPAAGRKGAVQKGLVLGDFAYKTYFDRNGTPPPYPFLQPLKEGSSFARIVDGRLVFKKPKKEVPIVTPGLPPLARPAAPYLLSAPNRVLLVHPYYLHQDKENRFVTEVYSPQGAKVASFDSLPTHLLPDDLQMLISPERTECCESLKWTIRFYDLRDGTVSEYGCPEGQCGNVLFARLGSKGPFVIAQEIVGKVGEIGASVQTNLFVVNHDGRQLASGTVLHALREPGIAPRRLESLSPYSVSNLVGVDGSLGKQSWFFRFGREGEQRGLKLEGTHADPIPSPVFLTSKNPGSEGEKGDVRIEGKRLGLLPLLVVAPPGRRSFETGLTGESKEVEIRSDHVTVVMF